MLNTREPNVGRGTRGEGALQYEMVPLFGGVDHSIFDGRLGRIQMRGFSIEHGTGHGTCTRIQGRT